MNRNKVFDSVLDSYGYPEKPCNTNCVDACPDRLDCPLFLAWKQRIARDKEKLEITEKKLNKLKVTARLLRFEKWWEHFEPQSYPESYIKDEDEIRKAIARYAWKAALAFVLRLIGTVDYVKEIEKIEEAIRDELRGLK